MLYLKKPEILNLPIERRETYKTNSNLAEVAVSKALCHYHHHSLRNIRRRCRLLVLFKINTRFCRNWILAYLFVICRNLWWDDSWLESGDWGRWWIDDSIYCLKAEAFFFVKKKEEEFISKFTTLHCLCNMIKRKVMKGFKDPQTRLFQVMDPSIREVLSNSLFLFDVNIEVEDMSASEVWG